MAAVLVSGVTGVGVAQTRTSASALLRHDPIPLPIEDKQDVRFVPLSVDGTSFQHWTNSIVQDNYGFLWVAGEGLYRYDGYTLKPYRHEPGNDNSLSDESVNALYKDRAGMLWIGTAFGGLDRLDPTRETFTHYRHKRGDERTLSDNSVNCIYQDREGALWVGTDAGLDRLDPVTGAIVHYRHQAGDAGTLSNNTVLSVSEDAISSALWIGTAGGLNKLDRQSGRVTRFVHDPTNSRSLGHPVVSAIAARRADMLGPESGELLVGRGLSVLDATTGAFKRYAFRARELGRQLESSVNNLYQDREGTLWLCTFDNGLLKFDRERRVLIRYRRNRANPDSLPHDTVTTLFEDAQGVMWVGTRNGVSRLLRTPSPFVTYRSEAGNPHSLRDNEIWSVQGDRSGSIWIGAEKGGLYRLDRRTGRLTLFLNDPDNPHSLSESKVSAIREDAAGTMWFGTYGGGLNRFDRATGRFLAYRHDPKDPRSLSNDNVLSLHIDRRGVLWVGTQYGGLNRFDAATRSFTAYRSDPTILRSLAHRVAVIAEDRAGMLWLGTQKGLQRFDPQTARFTVYHRDERDPRSLSNDKVNAIHEDRQGQLWVGTQNGLNLMDRTRGTFTNFARRDGLPDNTIEAIHEDERGYLWLATHDGLSRFHPPTKTFRNYYETDGLPSNLLNPDGAQGSWQSPGGELFVASMGGMVSFHPDRLSASRPYVPPVRLTGLSLFNKPVSPGGGSPLQQPLWATDSLTLTHEQSIFAVQFAAMSYAAPEDNRYRYRLEGLERDWNEVDGRRHEATYTSLPARRYVFRVQASTNGETWNEQGATLAITILPPWWATWWFRSLMIAGLVALVLAAHTSRVKLLQRSERRFRGLIENSSEHILLLDENGKRKYLSPSTFRFTGYRAEELLNGDAFANVHPDDVERVRGVFLEAMTRPGVSLTIEFRVRRKDGAWIWSESVATNLLSDPSVGAIVVNSRDITERREAERERHTREAATAANLAKTAFLANMSHEIRTPMNAVLGFAQLLQREAGLTPQQQEYLEIINRSGEHLLALINDVLEVSRIEAGRLTASEAAFNLHALLDDLERLFRMRANQKGLTLQVERAPALPRDIVSDHAKLRQILINLLGNAVKFTAAGGVVLRVSSSERDGAEGLWLLAEVEDTGPGIAAGDLGRLFQHFEQTETGRRAGGAGLGLAISRQFAELLGGSLTVDSHIGQGSVFRVRLAVARGAEAANASQPINRRVMGFTPGQPRYRVLIADDAEDNRTLMSQILGRVGFETSAARDGQEALDLLAAWPPDLLLLDLRMPVMDGLEVIRRVRAAGNALRIIVVTASVFDDNRDQVLALGADDFVRKPIREATLLARIGVLLGVTYAYADEEPAPARGAETASDGAVSPAMLAGLPTELIAELRLAILRADYDELIELIGQANALPPATAAALRTHVERFEYEHLLHLLPIGAGDK